MRRATVRASASCPGTRSIALVNRSAVIVRPRWKTSASRYNGSETFPDETDATRRKAAPFSPTPPSGCIRDERTRSVRFVPAGTASSKLVRRQRARAGCAPSRKSPTAWARDA